MPASSTARHLIRKARPTDLAALLLLENSCFQSDCISPRRMRHWINADNGILLVAQTICAIDTSQPSVAGYCLAISRRNSTTLRAYSLAIAEEARGQGLAARLLLRLEQEGRERRCTAIVLEVADGNAAAIALYEKLHYVRFAHVEGYYQDGRDALRMRKELVQKAAGA